MRERDETATWARLATGVFAGLVALVVVVVVGVVGVTMLRGSSSKPPNPYMAVPAEYRPIIVQAARTCDGLTPGILAGQLYVESRFQPDAKATIPGPDGKFAEGIAQFMPTTFTEYAPKGASVWNPSDAIPAMARMNCAGLAKTASFATATNRLDLLIDFYCQPTVVLTTHTTSTLPECVNARALKKKAIDAYTNAGPDLAGTPTPSPPTS